MLIQLSVENIAIIEKLTVELEDGLNILTGETGAGKSILIDAINALLGGRVSREIIRAGQEKAKVEAVFQAPESLCSLLNEMGIEPQEDGTLIVSRQFYASGKNICRINGNLVTVSQLRAVGEYLIDIHGQHENQSLLRAQAQSMYLDLFSGEKLLSEREAYRKYLRQYREINEKLKEIKAREKERARLEDLYRYQTEEISAACLQKGEDEDLLKQSHLLSHTEGILEAFHTAYSALSGEEDIARGALELVQIAQVAAGSIAGLDESFKEIWGDLTETADQLQEISRTIRVKLDQINYDPMRQQEVEERLALVETLKKKYGNTVEEILSYGKWAEEKLEEITGAESMLEKLLNDSKRLDALLYEKAGALHKMRMEAGKLLRGKIVSELRNLEMPKVDFQTEVLFDEKREYTDNGLDSIAFLISPNPGEGLKPLSRIASGGELSRVMLAIKSILADIDKIGVLIFDEIDAGVSGKAALKVGEKLLEVSEKHQVICITHHAQIASLAKAHYHITKKTEGNRTTASINRLDKQEREMEIARLLSGENNESTKKLAREMLSKGERLRGKGTGKQTVEPEER